MSSTSQPVGPWYVNRTIADRRFAPLTDSELAAIEARAAAAAPGPWKASFCEVRNHESGREIPPLQPGERLTIYNEGGHDEADAEFIAHSRTDVPRLVAEVRKLRAALRPFADHCYGVMTSNPKPITAQLFIEAHVALWGKDAISAPSVRAEGSKDKQ